MAIETPGYTVVEKDKNFEIRDYEPCIIATVTLNNMSFEKASNIGFRLIADYIFGNNTTQSKVAMTAPVIQASKPQSEKIAMTAPVNLAYINENSYEVSFFMPKKYTLETLPKPNNTTINLREVPANRKAIIKFSGGTQQERVNRIKDELTTWMKKKNLNQKSEATLARYDPPYVPKFLRKNEISILIKVNNTRNLKSRTQAGNKVIE